MSQPGSFSVAAVRPWTTLSVRGPDSISWLNGLVTCDVGKVAEGVGTWGLLLTKRGKITSELTLVQGGEGMLVGTSSESTDLARQLDDFLVMEDVELEDEGNDRAWIQIHGPGAEHVASRQVGIDAAWARVDWLPTGGAALVVPRSGLDECLAKLRKSDDVQLLDEPSWQDWRIAHGLPQFGIDFGPDDNPHQAGLDRRAVSWTKGCYLGQEVVCMQDMRGKVKRKLAKLSLPDGLPVEPGDEVNGASGDPVGAVTSVTDSSLPAGQPRAAIAQLRTPHFEPGTTVYLRGTPLTTAALWG